MTTVAVSPTEKNPSHHVSLGVSGTTYGLYVARGARGIREYPFSPSSLKIQQGRQGYGSFEPPYTSIDQVDFSGGRGQLRYEDPTKFYDSYNMWTMTPGLMMPAPLWKFTTGMREEYTWMPGDVLAAGDTQNTSLEWVALDGDQEYVAIEFTTVAALEAENIWLLLKYNGTPGTLTVHLYDDSSGPSSTLGNVTLAAADVAAAMPEGDLVGQLVCFQFTTPVSLSATTDYWIVVQSASTDNTTNFFEVAAGSDGTLPAYEESPDDVTWTADTTRGMYYRITDANKDQEIHWQEYKRALYACTEPLDGSPGKIYLNGDRGAFSGGGTYGATLEPTTAYVSYAPSGGDGTGAFLEPPWICQLTQTDIDSAAFKFHFGFKFKHNRDLPADTTGYVLSVEVEHLSGDNPSKVAMAAEANNDPDLGYAGEVDLAQYGTATLFSTASTVSEEVAEADGYFSIEWKGAPAVLQAGVIKITKIQWYARNAAVYHTVWEESEQSEGSDSTKSWTVDEWAGAYCHIWNGTGEGQYRKIISNTADKLTIEPNWDIQPVSGGTDVGSEYVIVGTNTWQDVTPEDNTAGVSIVAPITDTLTLWGVLYLAQGEKGYIVRVREYNNSGTWTDFWGSNSATATVDHDGTNYALFLDKTYDPVHENFIWRTRNENTAEFSTVDKQTSVSKANDVIWGTDLTFGDPIPIGTPDFLINGTAIYNNKLWIGKEDSLWYLDWDGSRDRAYPIQVGLEAITSPNNCKAMAAQNLYLYFNWAHSVERYYGGTMDDVGPWKGQGLIKRAQGHTADLQPAIGWMFECVDGGDENQSSVVARTHGYHTLFRAPSITQDDFDGDQKNPRIRSINWQSVHGKDSTNYLWFEMGGDIMSMPMPRTSLNPALDDDMMFAPESYVIQSRMDAMFPEQEKYFDKVRISSPAVTGTIYSDYVVDPGIDDPSFTNAGSGTAGPSIESDIQESRARRVMNRIRISPSDLADTTQNTIEASVTDAVARMPVKYQWDLKVRMRDKAKTLSGLPDHDPDTLYTQLKTWSKQAQTLTMNSVLTQMHAKTVFIEPPSALRDFWNRLLSWWGGTITITVREA